MAIEAAIWAYKKRMLCVDVFSSKFHQRLHQQTRRAAAFVCRIETFGRKFAHPWFFLHHRRELFHANYQRMVYWTPCCLRRVACSWIYKWECVSQRLYWLVSLRKLKSTLRIESCSLVQFVYPDVKHIHIAWKIKSWETIAKMEKISNIALNKQQLPEKSLCLSRNIIENLSWYIL